MSGASSESWAHGAGADIIDLDRYMRGSVRPLAARVEDSESEELVVDAGERARRKSPYTPSYKSRDKRYSHDSGLSDSSDLCKRRRYSRAATESTSRLQRNRSRGDYRPTRKGSSGDSLRKFKAVCEQALKEQQEQLARVAQLCEQLTSTVVAAPPSKGAAVADGKGGAGTALVRRTARRASRTVIPFNDSSDISSSSSHSTPVRSRKDRHRDECKTYKLIMTKLDELNRMFVARRTTPCRALRAPSQGTVSVSDKVVATEVQEHSQRAQLTPIHDIAPPEQLAQQSSHRAPPSVHSPPSIRSTHVTERGVGEAALPVHRLATARAHSLDIAPAPRSQPPPAPPPAKRSGCLNVATESVTRCSSEGGSTCSAHEQRCCYETSDIVQLYPEGRRPRARTPSPCARYVPSPPTPPRCPSSRERSCAGDKHRPRVHSHKSLCGRCQCYWRTLASYAAQLFSPTEDTSSHHIA